MTAPGEVSARRAARLLRWYPAAWRARYGDEFAELLIAEFAEQPTSWRRAADVARGGLLARLARAGLAGYQPESPEQVRAGLATAACAMAASGALGVAIVGPPAEVTVTLTAYGRPEAWVAIGFGAVMLVVVLDFPAAGLFMIITWTMPEDALCVASPEYFPITVFIAAVTNRAEHDVDPLDRCPAHSFLVPDQNVTVPPGVLPLDLTVADSFTLAWT